MALLDVERARKYKRQHPDRCNAYQRRWYKRNPEKRMIYQRIRRHPELYPLSNQCVFCGETENLQHGHLDYQDDGSNYLTVCPACNKWMDK